MEETEHALYNRVRAAEMQRRKQEQDVQRIFNDLESLTKENQKRMRVCASRCLFNFKLGGEHVYFFVQAKWKRFRRTLI